MRTRFGLILFLAIAVSGAIKSMIGVSVIRPNDWVMAEATGPALRKNGFEVAGAMTFAGRASILARKEPDCRIHIVPVSEQGWHDESIRMALEADDKLNFVWRGRFDNRQQIMWEPWIRFYVGMALTFVGFEKPFYPTYAIVSNGHCNLEQVDWSQFPPIRFRRLSFSSDGFGY